MAEDSDRSTRGENGEPASEDDSESVARRLDPAAAFDAVAHETRVGILRALDEADGPVSFGDLRHRVGADDPGRFNYHLRKLDGGFVRSTDGGYVLAPPGRRVVGAIHSGVLTKSLEGDATHVEGSCTVCGSDLRATFEDDRVRIECPDCGWTNSAPAVPPAVLEGWTIEAVPGAVGRWLQRKSVSAKLRICPNCDGRLDCGLYLPGEDAAPDWFDGHISAAVRVATCRHCGHWWHSIVERAILVEPPVVAFHRDHGIDSIATPPWELDWMGLDTSSVLDRDPLRVAVRVPLDSETQSFVVDRDCSVVEVRTEPDAATDPGPD